LHDPQRHLDEAAVAKMARDQRPRYPVRRIDMYPDGLLLCRAPEGFYFLSLASCVQAIRLRVASRQLIGKNLNVGAGRRNSSRRDTLSGCDRQQHCQ